MPPALSDPESSGDEQVPPQKTQKTAKAAKPEPVEQKEEAEEEEEEEADEDDGDEEGPDEFVVEKILRHKFVKGEIVFEVKWQGYEAVRDRTWEPEANMTGAIDVMHEYFEDIGGRPEPPTAGQKRKGRPSGVKAESSTPASSVKRAKQEKAWSPPPGSWEHDVSFIDTVEERQDPKTGSLDKFAYLVWANDKKTQHPLKHVYQKCPQKMLQYYESHLVFTQSDGVLIGGDDDESMESVY